jgi:hypothetical protein
MGAIGPTEGRRRDRSQLRGAPGPGEPLSAPGAAEARRSRDRMGSRGSTSDRRSESLRPSTTLGNRRRAVRGTPGTGRGIPTTKARSGSRRTGGGGRTRRAPSGVDPARMPPEDSRAGWREPRSGGVGAVPRPACWTRSKVPSGLGGPTDEERAGRRRSGPVPRAGKRTPPESPVEPSLHRPGPWAGPPPAAEVPARQTEVASELSGVPVRRDPVGRRAGGSRGPGIGGPDAGGRSVPAGWRRAPSIRRLGVPAGLRPARQRPREYPRPGLRFRGRGRGSKSESDRSWPGIRPGARTPRRRGSRPRRRTGGSWPPDCRPHLPDHSFGPADSDRASLHPVGRTDPSAGRPLGPTVTSASSSAAPTSPCCLTSRPPYPVGVNGTFLVGRITIGN